MDNILKLNIKKVKDCWGGYSYIGYKDGKQYTECCDSIEEMKEKYDIFKDLEIISKKEWNKISNDYKGIFSDCQGTAPHLKGLKTKLKLVNGATTLVFEGIHFIVIDL